MAGRENPSPKARFPIVGAGCTGPFHTLPTNAATFVSRGCGGYTRHPSPEPRTQRLTGRNTGAISPSATAWLCAASEIATERTAGGSGRTPYGVCPLSPASRARRHAQPGRCCFRSRERFSLAEFVPTVSSPAPAAVPVLLETAVRSRGDSCRSAVDSIPPSFAAAPPAPPR